jgi:hypothetical protein
MRQPQLCLTASLAAKTAHLSPVSGNQERIRTVPPTPPPHTTTQHEN